MNGFTLMAINVSPCSLRVVAVKIPASDCLDSPSRTHQRLEIPAIFGSQLVRHFQQLFNSLQDGIFGFVEDVISFSGQFQHGVHLLSL